MGGLIDFVVSVNKIALFAFFAISGFLVYEVKKMNDENKKKQKPIIPQFDSKIWVQSPKATYTPLPPQPSVKKNEKGGSSLLMVIIGIIALIGVVGLIINSYIVKLKKQRALASIPIIREISSAGLKIYDTNWKEVENKTNGKIKPGDRLYVGIQTIVEADIDRARIKINALGWHISHITTLFNPQLKVYYKEYIVATGTAQLKIEAQLHSASDGWLGD